MPFASLAQEGWAHTHPQQFGEKNLKEFDAATKGKHLPERIHKESHMDGLGHAGKHAPHHTVKHSKIEHHGDGTHTVTHYHHDGSEHSHAVPNLDGVHDNLEEHLGAPNEGEEEEAAEMGGE